MRWCRTFFSGGVGGGFNVWAKTDLTQRKPSQRRREEARDRQRAGDIENNTKAPFQCFQSNSLLCWHHQSETRVGEFPCYCHLLSIFKSREVAYISSLFMSGVSDAAREWDHGCPLCHWLCFQCVFFNLEITHLDASISSPTLPFPHAYCCIIDCTLNNQTDSQTVNITSGHYQNHFFFLSHRGRDKKYA